MNPRLQDQPLQKLYQMLVQLKLKNLIKPKIIDVFQQWKEKR